MIAKNLLPASCAYPPFLLNTVHQSRLANFRRHPLFTIHQILKSRVVVDIIHGLLGLFPHGHKDTFAP